MSPRPILAIASLVFIAGGLLLVLLTVIGGAVGKNPTNQFYFLQSATTGIPGAAAATRWTFWNACSVAGGRNSCPGIHPAYPFDPPRNFGSSEGVPKQLIGTHKFYYETRFMFAFVFIGLFFAACALILGVLALCSKIASFLDSALISVALFFQSITAALMTAAYVQGRNAFRSNGQTASLGKYNFGFMWAAVVCYFLATVFLCAGGAASGSRSGGRKSGGSGGKGGMFGRKKSNRDRGSFVVDKETAVDGDRSSFQRA